MKIWSPSFSTVAEKISVPDAHWSAECVSVSFSDIFTWNDEIGMAVIHTLARAMHYPENSLEWLLWRWLSLTKKKRQTLFSQRMLYLNYSFFAKKQLSAKRNSVSDSRVCRSVEDLWESQSICYTYWTICMFAKQIAANYYCNNKVPKNALSIRSNFWYKKR